MTICLPMGSATVFRKAILSFLPTRLQAGLSFSLIFKWGSHLKKTQWYKLIVSEPSSPALEYKSSIRHNCQSCTSDAAVGHPPGLDGAFHWDRDYSASTKP